jgi:hypothetical protein
LDKHLVSVRLEELHGSKIVRRSLEAQRAKD